MKSWLIGKDADAGRDWGPEEKGMTEDEMAGWHHWLDGRESEWTPGVGDEQEGLACCDSWGRKESDTTEQLNWTEQLFNPLCPTSCINLKKVEKKKWDNTESGWEGDFGFRSSECFGCWSSTEMQYRERLLNPWNTNGWGKERSNS